MHPNGFLNISIAAAAFFALVFLLRTYCKQARTRKVRRIESRLVG